ncbi:hypothetical protein FB556_2020 [Enteractinococcus coprophilus]|uniref:Uncharacterized protein n=2 Tax=Enteractinococcus coprophilus TaxID=1027633 RepID=A0A543AG35_9MICC|nr:hypothetical protein FB556_2020 [Enteractinococcus coprophilus]
MTLLRLTRNTGVQMSETKGLEINWLGATGSALGSVTSAVLLSTLGASGTVIGAGLGTLIIGVGGSIYAYYLQRAKSNIEKTADKAKRTRRFSKRPKDQLADNAPITAQKDATHAIGAARAQSAKPGLKDVLRDMPWKRVAWWVAGLFVVTMAIILVFELATGRPVSSYTGGTSPASSGTSFTGVTDPARDDPEWTPDQQHQPGIQDQSEIPQPTQAPTDGEEDSVVPENEPTAAPEAPRELPQQQPEQAPQQAPQQAPVQEEPAEPVD